MSVTAPVEEALRRVQPARVWIGFSGGLDSTALLLAAAEVLKQWRQPPQLYALHVNHGLDPVAGDWADHCRQVISAPVFDRRVSLSVHEVDVATTGNLEANARRARWEVFAASCQANDLLLLAHHAQDQTETLLQRLFTGRGWLPMRSSGAVGQGRFVRPWLNVTRDELRRYVQAHNLSWLEDPSNTDLRFDRNFIRHQIYEHLDQRFPQVDHHVQRVAATQVADHQALVSALGRLPQQFSLAWLPEEHAPRRAWLRAYLESRGHFRVRDAALDAWLAAPSLARLDLSTGYPRLMKYANTLYYEKAPSAYPQSTKIQGPGEWLLPWGTLVLESCAVDHPQALPADLVYSLGARQGGERIVTAEGNKTLKSLLQSARVPPWRRADYPLLLAEEALVCVPGLSVAALPRGAAAVRAVWRDRD